MKITKSVNLVVEGEVKKPLTAKEKLEAEAVELGIDVEGKTSAQLKEAIAEAKA